jgi:dCMP deaminase
MNRRPTWEQYFKEMALLTATRSPCERLHVGCILVKDNRIIAQGYNGYLPGASHKQIMRNNHEIATIHAEQNAVTDCAKRGVSTLGATAFITHFPCVNCMKLLCASGIENIKYIEDYHNDDLVVYFGKEANVAIKKLK